MIAVDTQLTCHDVVSDAPVRARITVGASQRSIWTMALGVDPVASGTESCWIDLGAGQQLRGNRLEVRTVLMDVEGSSEDLICAIEVEGPGLTRVELRRPGNHGDIAALVLAVLLQ
jgi:hypothetical protein